MLAPLPALSQAPLSSWLHPTLRPLHVFRFTVLMIYPRDSLCDCVLPGHQMTLYLTRQAFTPRCTSHWPVATHSCLFSQNVFITTIVCGSQALRCLHLSSWVDVCLAYRPESFGNKNTAYCGFQANPLGLELRHHWLQGSPHPCLVWLSKYHQLWEEGLHSYKEPYNYAL